MKDKTIKTISTTIYDGMMDEGVNAALDSDDPLTLWLELKKFDQSLGLVWQLGQRSQFYAEAFDPKKESISSFKTRLASYQSKLAGTGRKISEEMIFNKIIESVPREGSWENAKLHCLNNKLNVNPAAHCGLGGFFPNERGLDPEAYCTKCRHRHKSKFCYRLHPELAPSKKIKSTSDAKQSLKKAATSVDIDTELSDSDSSGVMIAASSRFNESLTIYDTGASHHFVNDKSMFLTIKKTDKPFKFDQAVGSSSLDSTGMSVLTIGNLKLKLHDAIYSPSSTCSIVSAGRLERISNIVPNYDEMILIKRNSHQHHEAIAKLIRKNDVYYVSPITNSTCKTQIVAAPGVARLPTTTSAQRWHERLGHTGQTILKRTAQTSKGLEGIDLDNLTTCETCHLSKVQRFVSREPRPTPNQPLDEIHVDTVGKVAAALNSHQYIVVITDAKTRMRWCITTETKDQIAPQIIQWVKTQEHQYGKMVRVIFKDGGHGAPQPISQIHTPASSEGEHITPPLATQKATPDEAASIPFREEHIPPSIPNHRQGEHVPPPPLSEQRGEHVPPPPFQQRVENSHTPSLNLPIESGLNLTRRTDMNVSTDDFTDTESLFLEADDEGELSPLVGPIEPAELIEPIANES
ncbi:unnamed protein product [Trifolium pratense]|uniref:Uncharacterized protein n=1 Tax=Trifolium pratense TaxID=57577 RepID=A0ACB0JLJ6_TRIPR|nr:unnamed protein product [Trifolium pratense]